MKHIDAQVLRQVDRRDGRATMVTPQQSVLLRRRRCRTAQWYYANLLNP